jgi:hypothetical protein
MVYLCDYGWICTTLQCRELAAALEYNDRSQDKRRKLRKHRHEYLVYCGIATDENPIIAIFRGDGPEMPV